MSLLIRESLLLERDFGESITHQLRWRRGRYTTSWWRKIDNNKEDKWYKISINVIRVKPKNPDLNTLLMKSCNDAKKIDFNSIDKKPRTAAGTQKACQWAESLVCWSKGTLPQDHWTPLTDFRAHTQHQDHKFHGILSSILPLEGRKCPCQSYELGTFTCFSQYESHCCHYRRDFYLFYDNSWKLFGQLQQ